MENEKIAWWRYVLAVIVFAALFLAGGYILIIWNALSPRAFRYEQGDLGYYIMQILTGPVGVLVANFAAYKIIGEKRSILLFVLNIVGAVFAVFICLLPLIATGEFTLNTLSTLLAGVTAVIAAVVAFKDYSTRGKEGGGDGQNS